MARDDSRNTALRLSAALVPTAPLTLYSSLLLAAYLPLSDQARAAVGLYGPLPLYSLLACLVARMRHGGVAWAVCLAATAAFKLLTVLR